MKTFRLLFLLVLIAGAFDDVAAKEVPEDLARKVAANAWNERVDNNRTSQTDLFGQVIPVFRNSDLLYFALNRSENKGFIIIAGDDRVSPVLAFSDHGNFSETTQPAAVKWFFGYLEKQILYILHNKDFNTREMHPEFARYQSDPFSPQRDVNADPLVLTQWNQGCYYNADCPYDASATGTCSHALTGCGATAMAQILKYWNYPLHGTGSYGYNHPVYGYLSANFSAASYYYSSMPVSISAPNAEIAQLMYHCGVAQEMDYGPSTSGSYLNVVDDAFINYFGYSDNALWQTKASFDDTQWSTLLRQEIDASRPVFYFGSDNGNNGHFFICDGYQGTDFFHMNWGWGGQYDGYYYLTDLTPGTNYFTDGQAAIFDLYPESIPLTYNMDFESVPSFSFEFTPWTYVDVDQSPTYSITNYSFPNQGSPMAYICFQPSAVTPPMTDQMIQPHGGQKFGASFAAATPPNNDWLISPQIQLGQGGQFSFWVKSYTSQYGLEKFRVGISTTGNSPADFIYLSGIHEIEAPLSWTQKTYGLSDYDNQKVYLAIQCISNDAFIFMVDDIVISTGASGGTLTADFSANQTVVQAGGSVNFTDLSAGNPTTWEWSFPGGAPATSTLQNPTNIVYNTPGTYDVVLTVSDGTDSDTRTIVDYITVNPAYPSTMTLDFEGLSDFTMGFTPWTTADINGGQTYTIQNVTFPNQGDPMAYLCFNPMATTPPLESMTAHSGSRFGACFSSVPPNAPNDKWLISPQMFLGSNAKIELWVQSYTDDYGLEEYNIGISTTGNDPQDFEFVNGTVPEQATTEWTKKTYSLTDWTNQSVFVAINCVSDDAFIFMIDDIFISSTVGLQETPGQNVTIYPNPASGKVFVNFMPAISGSVNVEIISLLGATVKTVNNITGQPLTVDLSGVQEGLYIIKIAYGQNQIIRKVHIVD